MRTQPLPSPLPSPLSSVVTTWVNGNIVHGSDAIISCHDEGLLRGWGLFETMLAIDGRLPLWPEHWRRLQFGARLLGIAVPPGADLESACRATLAAARENSQGNPPVDAMGNPTGAIGPQAGAETGAGQPFVEPSWNRVRLTLTAGPPATNEQVEKPGEHGQSADPTVDCRPGGGRRPTIVVTVEACRAWTLWVDQPGQDLVIYPHPLDPPFALRGCKSTSYLPWLLAGHHATGMRADDALILDSRGSVVETARRNVFVWLGSELWTPPLSSGCLPGVMRGQVIASAEVLGIPVRQEPLTVADLQRSEAVFLTSAVTGIQRVGRLEDRKWSPAPQREMVDLERLLRGRIFCV